MERENPTIVLFQFFTLFLFRFLRYMKLVYLFLNSHIVMIY